MRYTCRSCDSRCCNMSDVRYRFSELNRPSNDLRLDNSSVLVNSNRFADDSFPVFSVRLTNRMSPVNNSILVLLLLVDGCSINN